MKLTKILKTSAATVISLYFLSVFLVFVPYYNWQFWRDHGFASWIFFGELAPTGKALVWPYFVWSDRSEGIRRDQAREYFYALDRTCSAHPPMGVLLRDAIVRADEREKVLGKKAGNQILVESFRDIAKTIHSDVEKSASIVPPAHLAKFHSQSTAEARRCADILDQMVLALEASDGARIDQLGKQLDETGKRSYEQIRVEAQKAGVKME